MVTARMQLKEFGLFGFKYKIEYINATLNEADNWSRLSQHEYDQRNNAKSFRCQIKAQNILNFKATKVKK